MTERRGKIREFWGVILRGFKYPSFCDEDRNNLHPEPTSIVVQFREVDPARELAIEKIVEALDIIDAQNRTKGYPTGAEWRQLINKINEGLAEWERVNK